MPGRPQHKQARALRRESTHVERVLWAALRGRQVAFKFRRQHPIPPYVADFACVEAMIVIELDGGQHGEGKDATRHTALTATGWLVLRYWNSAVIENLEGVIADIVARATARTQS